MCEQLHQYYLQFATPSKRSKTRANTSSRSFDFERLKQNRDLSQVRKRYLRLSRNELADRLIQAEEYIIECQSVWLKNLMEQFK